MAKKQNSSAREIDLTSFDFAVYCGKCHPGGGPLEYDRKGNRYDLYAADPNNGITSGGENFFDGDYYKARWAATGVIEADCLLCHSPGYDIQERNAQIAQLNFKWAATAGSGVGSVKKRVRDGEHPVVRYNEDIFDAEGHIDVPIVKEVPVGNCLFCHRETDWKKKGTSYMPRFDVHLRAGMKCIECHPAGKNARDPRISTWEEHNFGKGDDPGSLVRDDLDDTVISCRECHAQGLNRAPVMRHASFSASGSFDAHSDAMSCQVCHVPDKAVKAALVQDSTVFNPLPRVPKLKKIWSFYGPDAKPWNYYGEGDLGKQTDRPLFFYTPQLRRYKEKLYPVAGLYSIWYGLKNKDTPALDQVFMKDIYRMWTDENSYPRLAAITDDNGDGFIEINRPAEIDAAIDSMTSHLHTQGVLKNRQVVLVDGADVYLSAHENYTLTSRPFEYSPYGSTFKLSHDIAPAGAALGAGGCSDCHQKDGPFFTRTYMVKPFDASGAMVTRPAYRVLRYSEDDLEGLEAERQ